MSRASPNTWAWTFLSALCAVLAIVYSFHGKGRQADTSAVASMPVTVNIVDHEANPWTENNATTSEKLFKLTSPRHWRRSQRLVQSSFGDSDQLTNNHVSPSENGFVHAAWRAYSQHHHLIIRPEDVWFSVLTQLSFYINANAEELRSFFVAHEGKEALNAISDVADFGALAVQMTELMHKKVNDPELRDWVLPAFSTTTDDDKVVGSILFMGAMQKYFDFTMTVTCGLPSVTLLGTIEDWQDIEKRIDKILQLGAEATHFASMLRQVLKYFVKTFEKPKSTEVQDFWNRIVTRNRVGSGTDYLTGWLTAFCYWDHDGKTKRTLGGPQRSRFNEAPEDTGPDPLFGDVYFLSVDIDDIPAGYASVPVHVNDNGNEFEATMVAGSVGIAAVRKPSHPPDGVDPSEISGDQVHHGVQPVSGWWMYENEAPGKAQERAAERKLLDEQIEACFETEDESKWDKYFALSRRLEELRAY